ncbi:phospholipase A1 2-like [Spodoptera frugiperda]|uniref:Phospholipase A1 2-like n=1 Tax=Spodoptera frugiperda TaxID=7108 RepID=A0A9R0F579_SPOFR|nr:phospholipase A1 2-like [Spodoptera frugiperda]
MRVFSLYLFSFICLSGITNISGGKIGTDVLNWVVGLTTKCDVIRNETTDVSKLTVHFYDFQSKQYKSSLINKAAKDINKIDKNKKLYVFIGGFRTHIEHKTADLARETFKTINDSYLIIIDHQEYTNDASFTLFAYKKAVPYVPSIGKEVAKMLAQLNKKGIDAKRIHAIGHSLGSQILGYVGQNFFEMTNKRIARITALDPAGPCFSDRPREEQIRSGVADYVEVYHSDFGFLGTTSVLGDVDFFLNREKSEQPQCKEKSWLKKINYVSPKICSHSICVKAWMSTVAHKDRFEAIRCDSYELFKAGNCSRNAKTKASFWNHGGARGKYYITTKDFVTF